jgi:hypothetical protein
LTENVIEVAWFEASDTVVPPFPIYPPLQETRCDSNIRIRRREHQFSTGPEDTGPLNDQCTFISDMLDHIECINDVKRAVQERQGERIPGNVLNYLIRRYGIEV